MRTLPHAPFVMPDGTRTSHLRVAPPLPPPVLSPERSTTRQTILTAMLVIGLCGGLVAIGTRWPDPNAISWDGLVGSVPGLADASEPVSTLHPVVETVKLASAALIGLLVTVLQKQTRREGPMSRSMEHAQVLLCVSGAMMMIIIGNSLARAFGIAGAASIIRFRTPVEDPKDITILFLLMALGMACGLGAFAVAGLGTLFLCAALLGLDHLGEARHRTVLVELVADGPEFPVAHVRQVFAAYRVRVEPREVTQGPKARARFLATFDASVPLDALSDQLVGSGGTSGIKSISWETRKAA